MTYDEWYEYLRYCRAKSDYIAHHGILGQKWYHRRYQNADGSLTAEGKIRYNKHIDKETKRSDKYYNKEIKNEHHHNNGVKGMKRGVRKKPDTVFVSGSSKTTFEDSGYYRRALPKPVRDELDSHMAKGSKIVVGDAPGIDRQVQDYLNSKDYGNVAVYGPGKAVRYSANKNWKTNPVDAPEFEVGSKEWLAKKDIEMSNAATKGIAVVLDNGSSATRKNVDRLIDSHKDVKVYELNGLGEEYDSWINPKKGKSKTNNHKRNLLTR